MIDIAVKDKRYIKAHVRQGLRGRRDVKAGAGRFCEAMRRESGRKAFCEAQLLDAKAGERRFCEAGRRESERVSVFTRRGDVKASEKHFCEAQLDAKAVW